MVLEDPLYDQAQAQNSLALFARWSTRRPSRSRPASPPSSTTPAHPRIVDRELHVEAQGSTPARTLVFSGDLGRTAARSCATHRYDAADYVFVESTYGGRTHEPEEESLTQLAQAVTDVIAQNGVLLIPAFAIGRTQEIVWALEHLLDAGRIPGIKLYLDSPMASKASTIYREHRDYYDAKRWLC